MTMNILTLANLSAYDQEGLCAQIPVSDLQGHVQRRESAGFHDRFGDRDGGDPLPGDADDSAGAAAASVCAAVFHGSQFVFVSGGCELPGSDAPVQRADHGLDVPDPGDLSNVDPG